MAKSYYKQSERPVVEGINWGQISTDLSAKLLAEEKRREDLKIKLDEESRDYMREFNDTPQGQHDGANERMARFASDASAYMLDLDKKLKAGQLPLKQYNAMRANLKQGTIDMFEVSKKFNADYAASLERANSGNASAEEIYQNAQIQAFGDPANSGVYIDPVTGQMSVGKMVDDGDGNMVMSSNPSDRKSIFSLKNTVERKIDNFNVNEFSEGIKGAYDVKYQRVIESGDVGLLDDMKKNPDFVQATNDLIQRELVNTHNAASILTNRAGKEYRFETLPNNKLPEVQEEGVIYLVPDPTNPNSGASQPLLTEKQQLEAGEILRTAIDSKIGVTETSSLEVKRESQKLANKLSQEKLDQLLLMNPIEIIKESLNVEQLKQLGEQRAEKHESDMEAAESIEEKRQIELKYLEEEKQLKILNTETMMDERAAKNEADLAAAKTTEEKQRIQIKYLDDKLKLDNDLLEQKIKQGDKKNSTALKDYNTYVQNRYTLSDAEISDEDIAEENLVMAYGDLGFKFDTSNIFDDAIKITSPDGEATTTIILDSPNAEQSIHSFININTPIEAIGRLSKSGGLTKSEKEEADNTTPIDTSSY